MCSELIKDATTFQTKLKELEKSPLFYAFGENKENFHSSFWQWMFTLNKKATIKILTGENDDVFNGVQGEEITFKREVNISNGSSKPDEIHKARCDVLISVGRKRFIIETKVKSFPSTDQLERIKNSESKENDTKFICIHLYPADSLKEVRENSKGWTFISLDSISEAINDEDFQGEKVLYVQDYKTLLKNISSLFDLFQFNDENPSYNFTSGYASSKEGNKSVFDHLNEFKLWELFVHYRSKHFFSKIMTYLKSNGFDSSEIYNEAGIHHKNATLSFGYALALESEKEKDRSIRNFNKNAFGSGKIMGGVELEGDQFRKFIISRDDDRFKAFEEKNFFEKCNCGQNRSKNGPSVFGPHFKYKYFKIDSKTSLDFIKEEILNTLNLAKKIQKEDF